MWGCDKLEIRDFQLVLNDQMIVLLWNINGFAFEDEDPVHSCSRYRCLDLPESPTASMQTI